MTILKRHWLTIVLALAAVLLLAGFIHRCNHAAGAGGTPSGNNRSLNSVAPANSTPPATPTNWIASLDWQAIGMAVGALLTGIGAFYQLLLKFKAGHVSIEAVIDGGKSIFGEAKDVEAAFKKPTQPAISPPKSGLSVYQSSVDAFETLKKMDKPPTMEKPTS